MSRALVLLLVYMVPLLASADRVKTPSVSPDIGLNLLLLYQNSNRGQSASDESRNGASLQEAELQFSADVSVEGDVTFTGSPEAQVKPGNYSTGEYPF